MKSMDDMDPDQASGETLFDAALRTAIELERFGEFDALKSETALPFLRRSALRQRSRLKQKGAPFKLLSGGGDFPENGLTPRARGCESFFLAAADENVDSLVDVFHPGQAVIRRDTTAQAMQRGEERGRSGSAIDRRQNRLKRKRHLRLRHQRHQRHRLDGAKRHAAPQQGSNHALQHELEVKRSVADNLVERLEDESQADLLRLAFQSVQGCFHELEYVSLPVDKRIGPNGGDNLAHPITGLRSKLRGGKPGSHGPP